MSTNEWLRNCVLVPMHTLLCVDWLASSLARSQRSHVCTRGESLEVRLSFSCHMIHRPQVYCSDIHLIEVSLVITLSWLLHVVLDDDLLPLVDRFIQIQLFFP